MFSFRIVLPAHFFLTDENFLRFLPITTFQALSKAHWVLTVLPPNTKSNDKIFILISFLKNLPKPPERVSILLLQFFPADVLSYACLSEVQDLK